MKSTFIIFERCIILDLCFVDVNNSARTKSIGELRSLRFNFWNFDFFFNSILLVSNNNGHYFCLNFTTPCSSTDVLFSFSM